MCQPTPEGRLQPSCQGSRLIIAREPRCCQLHCANFLAGRNVKGNLHTTQSGESVPHMSVNAAHNSPAADRSLIAVGVNENKNLALLLRPCQQLLQRVKVLVPTNKLRGSGTLGTDDATDDDHGFFSRLLRVNCEGYYTGERKEGSTKNRTRPNNHNPRCCASCRANLAQ